MKGKLIKDDEGWWVQHKAKGLDGNLEYIAESMLHPDDVKQIEEDAKMFDNIEARIAAYPDVEFEMVTEVVASIGDLDTQDYYSISYAKLIPSKEQQKQLITEIMEEDAKDGLYEDKIKVTIKKDSEAAKAFESLREDKQEFKENVQSGKIMPPHIKEKIDKLTGELKKVYELAEQSWEGCDGCNENDKYFFMKGFQAGYNRAKPDELSDDEKNDEYLLKCLTIFSNKLLESEQSKNDGIPRLMYKDGREIRSYHSPKLDNILKEISDEEIEKAAKECRFEDLDISVGSFELGAKWYREQLKQRQ